MKILIFGASGMVGTEVLHQVIEDQRVEKIVSIGRSHIDVESPILEQISHDDFLNYDGLEGYLSESDICFYCLGVYQNQVSKQDFWEITVDYLDALIGSMEKVNSEIIFCLFSAQGANQDGKSLFRFGNAKGCAEKKLLKSKITKKYIFRPGFINPGRKAAFSGVSLMFYQAIYKILPSLGIDAVDLAKVMIHVGLVGQEEIVIENVGLRRISKEI